jgi:hypothetical protein
MTEAPVAETRLVEKMTPSCCVSDPVAMRVACRVAEARHGAPLRFVNELLCCRDNRDRFEERGRVQARWTIGCVSIRGVG